ncbi:rhombosortase [Neptuniibacter sp. QD48_55]|uniref:rhombosortase n=1 Tax=Neptuniibacter sp. QD48_55 TaxID=3398212 RepID=UPI0039F4BBB9
MNLFTSIATALRGGCDSRHALNVNEQPTKVPLITLSIIVSVLGIGLLGYFYPVLSWLCFDYALIAEQQQQYWRLFTAHFVHSSTEHLFWDLITFTAVAVYLEKRNQKLFIYGMLLSLITLSIYLLSPLTDIARYSGLSGILYTVICLAAWQWLREEKGFIAWLPLIAIAVKTVTEIFMQDTVFVTEGWAVFSEAHLVGAGTALLLGCYLAVSSADLKPFHAFQKAKSAIKKP